MNKRKNERRRPFDRRNPDGFEQIAADMTPEEWVKTYHPVLVTIKNGVTYYMVNEEAPFIAVKGQGIYRTRHYNLEDII